MPCQNKSRKQETNFYSVTFNSINFIEPNYLDAEGKFLTAIICPQVLPVQFSLAIHYDRVLRSLSHLKSIAFELPQTAALVRIDPCKIIHIALPLSGAAFRSQRSSTCVRFGRRELTALRSV